MMPATLDTIPSLARGLGPPMTASALALLVLWNTERRPVTLRTPTWRLRLAWIRARTTTVFWHALTASRGRWRAIGAWAADRVDELRAVPARVRAALLRRRIRRTLTRVRAITAPPIAASDGYDFDDPPDVILYQRGEPVLYDTPNRR